MSLAPGDQRTQDLGDTVRGPSRIPMRLARQKHGTFRPKTNGETQVSLKPQTGNRVKDEGHTRQTNMRVARLERERCLPKKHTAIKKQTNIVETKVDKDVIKVPLYNSRASSLQDMAQTEPGELQLMSRDQEGVTDVWQDPAQVKVIWHDYIKNFEQMKKDLEERQRTIVQLYVSMRNTHEKLRKIGQEVQMPSLDTIKIMNVAKLNSEQLLDLGPTNTASSKLKDKDVLLANVSSKIDQNKIHCLPTKLIATCELILAKRKEIIDWVAQLLTSQEKGVSRQSLEQKINEFSGEHDMLKGSFELAKGDFLKQVEGIIDFARKTMTDAVALHLRTENQMCNMSEINAENTDLKKQIQNSEISRPPKGKIEELEKQLEEERRKKKSMKDKLTRADGQIKMSAERASQLEAALEKAKAQTWQLEYTVQQLSEQSQQQQNDFENELNKLTASIRDNTKHLDEIAGAREKLQAEKEELEKRLGDLSEYYKESLNSVKHDMNLNFAKLIECEKKYAEQLEDNKNLLTKLESVCAESADYKSRNQELEIELGEKETLLSQATSYERELETTKRELEDTCNVLEQYKRQLDEQTKMVNQLKSELEDSHRKEEKMKCIDLERESYITDLENRHALLEKQLQDSENKMNSYETQLTSLKSHITQLQADFGEFDNLEELHDMVNQQRAKLLEATKQNGELAQALQRKDDELERHLETIAEQEQLIEEKVVMIKMLSEKEEEQTNVIKLLRNNLEMKTQADVDMTRQISEKNSEIKALIANVETRKQQIAQLEKIILTLEDQARLSNMQRRKKDQERINLLENRVAEFESLQLHNKPADIPDNNLDNIIKILEDELETSFEPQINSRSHEYVVTKKKYIGDQTQQLPHFENLKGHNTKTMYQTDHESIPTKIVMGNFVKKTYISNKDDHVHVDNLDRKKAITNIDTQNWATTEDPDINTYAAPRQKPNQSPLNIPPYSPFRDTTWTATHPFFTRTPPILNNNLREDKKFKMFKLAGHKL